MAIEMSTYFRLAIEFYYTQEDIIPFMIFRDDGGLGGGVEEAYACGLVR
jgi:hypothetical protein